MGQRLLATTGSLFFVVVVAMLLAGCDALLAPGSGVSPEWTPPAESTPLTSAADAIAQDTGGSSQAVRADVTPLPATAAAAGPGPRSAQATQTAIVKVKRSDLTGQVRLRGRVAASTEAPLAFQVGGRIKSVKVVAGDNVAKGAVLAELDDPDQQAQEQVETARDKVEVARTELATLRMPAAPSSGWSSVTEAQRRVEAARLRLARINAGPSASEIRMAEIAVEQAKNSLWAAQTSRDGVCGQGPTYACYGADAGVANADIALVAARARLDEVRNRKPVPEDVALATIEVRSAESALAAAQSTAYYDAELAQARAGEQEAAIRAKETEIRHLEANQGRLEARLGQLKLTAPFAGKVLAFDAKPGDKVESAQSLGSLADPGGLELEVLVPEEELVWVSPGQEGQAMIDGYQTQRFTAKVTSVGRKPAQSDGKRAFPVRLQFVNKLSVPVEVGTGADAYLAVTRSQVLVVPNAVVVRDGDRRYVVMPAASGTGTQRVTVQVGLANDTDVEIAGGLDEGADVIQTIARNDSGTGSGVTVRTAPPTAVAPAKP